MENAWNRAVAAEHRRSKRLGFIWTQPSTSWRKDDYAKHDLVKLGNCNGVIATYQVGPTGRITRNRDGSIGQG